jgi:Putative peptidoglycan binding domain
MKKLRLLSFVGITSIALARAASAGHAGGIGVGPSGIGHFGGVGGGGRFNGVGGGGPGARFSFGARPLYGHPAYVVSPNRITNSGAHVPSFVSQRNSGRSNFSSSQAVVRNSSSAITRNSSAITRNSSSGGVRTATTLHSPAAHPVENARNHIVARQDASAHRDWDRRGAHFWNRRWWAWDGGAWIGLQDGYYPWDYFPYYAYDYYPYDYYPGYYNDVEPYYEADGVSGGVPAPDPNVTTVQTDLTNLGYYHGPIDGLYGRATRDAVARYQTDHSLTATGTLTTQTLQALGIQPVAAS